ncbi:hypothetical protein DACRYDRAFT_107460 [Dacryopinax primogenitus]|uniref:Uncharacterized protein n=1 Tax=Dacryopinax primogenitus (strain DJM 731) TaxID=1858805 RepID=M5GCE8_DACPD|nr:uncharacterized protein DACRYDRAFT_107460 [Dacryopinax primogenitus]EJU01718.1 hypothetical protein DACRYDRAFT_107460 [Dacryopinax primogenitus]
MPSQDLCQVSNQSRSNLDRHWVPTPMERPREAVVNLVTGPGKKNTIIEILQVESQWADRYKIPEGPMAGHGDGMARAWFLPEGKVEGTVWYHPQLDQGIFAGQANGGYKRAYAKVEDRGAENPLERAMKRLRRSPSNKVNIIDLTIQAAPELDLSDAEA